MEFWKLGVEEEDCMQLDVVLKLKNVGKAYSRYAGTKGMVMNLLFPYRFRNSRFTAVQPLSLEITRGECVGIMGVNGSGKSTLLQMIAGTGFKGSGIDGQARKGDLKVVIGISQQGNIFPLASKAGATSNSRMAVF